MNLKSNLGILRLLALIEGISYLSFAITMPLKYQFDILWPNRYVGMAHGFLFIAYLIWVVIVAFNKKWRIMTVLWSFFASIIPFGTFVADKMIFSKEVD